MKLRSTRNTAHSATFTEALFRGLAPDGGLYVPVSHPPLGAVFTRFTPDTDFVDIAVETTARLLGEELDRSAVERVCRRAFPFSPVLTDLGGGIRLLELYHGPSCAFKDFGASFLASAMEELLTKDESRAVILTATSGDTGSAVARAFYGKRNIDVVILYPSGRVSPLQEKQLTTLGENISALEVKGSFDDCQRMVKEAFVDGVFSERIRLTSANSINIGRLLPQSFYYLYAAARSDRADGGPAFSVPSGNFGNLTAGVYAWKWGMKTRGFIAATNRNSVVPEYLAGGVYEPRPSVKTLSNAMDVGNPSNFERLNDLFGADRSKMGSIISGTSITDDETERVMKRIYDDRGIFIDPHTAVGYLAAERARLKAPGAGEIIVLATAHPGKFIEVVGDAVGRTPDLPERLSRVLALEKRSVVIENDLESLSRFLTDRFR